MVKLTRTGFLAVSLAALMLMSGVALAKVDDGPQNERDDTLLVYGYDPLNHLLFFNQTGTDTVHDCTPEPGIFQTGHGQFTDGFSWVESLMTADGTVMYQPRMADQLPEGLSPATAPLAYDGLPQGLCTLGAHLVDGPNGQVNHGQVVRTISHALNGYGHIGCLMRWIAQSDYGKGDQQVLTSEAVASFAPSATGQVELEGQLATCHNSQTSNHSNGNGNGKKGARGNSANAPGQNK